ncbi:hypothetical protein MO973_20635 [Paenibacillus sp. TRM 82003]|nr:hypothetical protein [Paenibacillus sp. TRM 82003]
MKWLAYFTFACGAGLLWFSLLAPLYRMRFGAVYELVDRFRRRAAEGELDFPEMTPQESAYIEKARSAGLSWSYRRFAAVRTVGAASGACLFAAAFFLREELPAGSLIGREGIRLLFGMALAGLTMWLAPQLAMAIAASRRRTRLLEELSKFAFRLSICMTDKADIREVIVRAGRPLRLLRPQLHRLAAQWGNDQREAILAFKDGVGISEAYPLVNAFAAISRAKAGDIGRLLAEHARSIDATLEAERTKRLENAPVWISFYVMIPFFICLLLFVYPWTVTVLEQLTVSFTAE